MMMHQKGQIAQAERVWIMKDNIRFIDVSSLVKEVSEVTKRTSRYSTVIYIT